MSLEDLWDLPADDDPVVVPASPVTVGGRRVPALQLRQVRAGGERVGLAFTSPRRLVAVLGPWQPWLGLLMGAYAQWLASAGVTRVHVDPVYADDVSTWTSSALVDAARGGEGYSAAAVVYEAGHEGHWTDHISKDGWVLGLGGGCRRHGQGRVEQRRHRRGRKDHRQCGTPTAGSRRALARDHELVMVKTPEPDRHRPPRRKEWADTGELLDLWLEAGDHGGVVPVPFLGTTWADRGAAYWRRRIGAALLMALLTLSAGFMASGFTYSFVKDGVLIAVAYGSTSLLGIRTGLRLVRRAPIDDSQERASVIFGGGIGALIFSPFALGLVLVILLSMLRRDFPGERRARELTEQWRTERPTFEHKKRRKRHP